MPSKRDRIVGKVLSPPVAPAFYKDKRLSRTKWEGWKAELKEVDLLLPTAPPVAVVEVGRERVPAYLGRHSYLIPRVYSSLIEGMEDVELKIEHVEGMAEVLKGIRGSTRAFRKADSRAVDALRERLEGLTEKEPKRLCKVEGREGTIHHLIPSAFARKWGVRNEFLFTTMALCEKHHSDVELAIDLAFKHGGELSLYDIFIISHKMVVYERIKMAEERKEWLEGLFLLELALVREAIGRRS